MILVDDLGIDQLGIYDGQNPLLPVYDDQNYYTDLYPYADTPNINSLAEDGVLFTQARANPVCSPTRISLNCGLYSSANGVGNVIFGPNQGTPCLSSFTDFLPSVYLATPLADVVRERTGFEYTSGLIGKSHLQNDQLKEPLTPIWCGDCSPECYSAHGWRYVTQVLHYDSFHGVLRGLASHRHPDSDLGDLSYDPPRCTRGTDRFWHFYWILDEKTNSTATRLEEDGTYYTAYEAADLIDWMDNAPEPYLAVWCTVDPHAPWEWPPHQHAGVDYHGFGEDPPPDPEGRGANINTFYRAKLEYLDTTIGDVLGSLTPTDRQKLTIIFAGDNGTPGPVMVPSADEESYPDCHPSHANWVASGGPRYLSTEPYDNQKMKQSVYEGGVRVPLIVCGATVDDTLKGTSSDQLVDLVDLHETIRELSWTGDTSGGYVPPLLDDHSQSFAPAFQVPSGTCVRNYSYSGTFNPNTDFPSGSWKYETYKKFWRDYYIHRDSSTGHLYKLLRMVEYSGGNPLIEYRLFRLDFSGALPTESFEEVPPASSPFFTGMKSNLEGKTGMQHNDF